MHALCFRINGCARMSPSSPPSPAGGTPNARPTAARGPAEAGLGRAEGVGWEGGADGRVARQQAAIPSAGWVEAVPGDCGAGQHWEEPAGLQEAKAIRKGQKKKGKDMPYLVRKRALATPRAQESSPL